MNIEAWIDQVVEEERAANRRLHEAVQDAWMPVAFAAAALEDPDDG